MIDLTDAGRAAIKDRFPDVQPGSLLWSAIIEAWHLGLAAGRERATEECAKVAMSTPDTFGTLADDSHKECAMVAARLIRSLM